MRILPVLALIAVSAFWGAHAVVGKTVEAQLGPFSLTVWRFTLSALFYIPWIPRILRVPRRILGQLALTGLVWAVVYPLLFYRTLYYLTPVETSLFINTSPIMAALLGWAFLREKMHLTQGIGILIAFGGVALSALSQWTSNGSLVGTILVLVAALSFAVYSVSSHSLSRRLPLMEMVAATSILGALELWVLTLVSGRLGSVLPSLTHLNRVGWEEFLYIVIFVSTISYVLYGYGLQRLPSSVSQAVTFYPQVLFTALVQWMLLDIRPGIITGVSAVLILGGVVLMQMPRRRTQ